MKKIIEGKRYNTDTAEKIANFWNGCFQSDFNHESERLYRTKLGNWFIHGEGGALSAYSVSYQGGRSLGGGEDIRVLSAAEARKWLELHNEADAIEKWFALEIKDA